MSMEKRLECLERRQGGPWPVEFWIVPHRSDGLVHGPNGRRMPLAAYERLHPDWRETAFTFTFAKSGHDPLLDEDEGDQ